MLQDLYRLLIVPLLILGLLAGCSVRTQFHLPGNMPQVSNGMARIVFTRESQLAGARWDLDLVDIGDKIEPNAMISYRACWSRDFIPPDQVLHATGHDIINDFYWRNPGSIKSIYCGDGKSRCNDDYGLGFYRGDVGLVWDRGIVVGLSGYMSIEAVQDGKSLSKQFDLANRLIRLLSDDDSELTLPPDDISNLFFYYFNNEKIIPLMEKLRKEQFERITVKGKTEIIGDVTFKKVLNLGELGLFDVPEKGIQGFRSDEAETTLVFTPPIPQGKSPCAKAPYLIDNRYISRNIQVMGKVGSGETIVWDRNPGRMRLAMVWYDGTDIMPWDIEVEEGKTYYLHYTVRQPRTERWELLEIQ